MQVFVRDNDINSALRVLKKKMQREGTFREMKRRRSYEKPSERRAREQAEAVRRHRKMMRKRLERRLKRSPIRDVACMLRSLQYVAYAALFGGVAGITGIAAFFI